MAIYYIRKSGNNSNNGTSPATAWLTINKALASGSTVAAGDTVYVGAGVYRETTAVAVSGSAGNLISVIGDVDGAQTGDAGQVTITGYTTNDKTVPPNTVVLALATRSYLSFSFLTFVSAATSIVTCTATGHDFSFTDCVFNDLGASATTGGVSALSFVSSTTGAALNITIDRCVVVATTSGGNGAISFSLATTVSGSADWDATVVVRNCFVLTQAGDAIRVAATSTNTFKGGGVRVFDCTLFASLAGFHTNTASQLSTSVPCEIHNSIVIGGASCLNAATSGQITEDHNLLNSNTPRTNVSAGTGSIADGSYAPLVELGQSWKWGGVIRQFMAPDGTASPLLGFGSGGSPAVMVDWQNRPRPSGGQSASNAVGYMELHDFSIQDTVTYNDAPSSGKLIGPGDQYIQVPVDAVTTTISIYLYFASYGGTNYPSATLLANGELGITTQTETCSSSASTWQKLTFTVQTPSKAGWVTIQVSSFDTGGTGQVNFDTLAVS